MEKQKNTQIVVIVLLAFVILIMSVGFAAYSSNLNINGTATIMQSKWSVHFDKDSYKEATNSVTAATKSIQDLAATYTVTLSKPGDFYQFDVDVVNDGTFDATLKSITLSTLTDAQKKYLTYEVTYNGTTYTSTNTSLNIDLVAGNSKTVTVKVAYIAPEKSTDLPSSGNVNVTLTAALGYEQKA